MLNQKLCRTKSVGVVLSIVFLAACVRPSSDPIDSAPTNTTSTTTVPSSTPTVEAGLYLRVKTAWETAPTTWVTHGTCSIPSGTGTAGSPATATCSIAIPEAQLYFSRLSFLVGTAEPSACKIILFHPYYYLGETADATFTPFWDGTGTEIDCMTLPLPAACFNGPATSIVSSFPDYRSTYFLSADASEVDYTVDSANTQAKTDNTYSCNNLLDPSQAQVTYTGAGFSFVGGSSAGTTSYDGVYSNYVVECRDEFFELIYSLSLTLEDTDSTVDHFRDWNGL